MSSTSVREPIGPRSVDDMLAEVYGRTARVRRRRQAATVLGAAVATLVTAAGLSLVGTAGDDDAARLKVVGRGDKDTATAHPSPPTTAAAGTAGTGTGTGTGQEPGSSKQKPGPSGRRLEAALPPPADGPVATSPVPTTAPQVRLLEEVDDAHGDATPNDWYLDVVRGAVEYDGARRVLVLTTAYREAANTGGTRSEHTMTSQVQYDNSSYGFDVVERNNALGDVKLDGGTCDGCTAAFDAARARLVVTVPLATFNAAVAARSAENPPFQSNSVVDGLVVTTHLGSGMASVQADTTADPEVGS